MIVAWVLDGQMAWSETQREWFLSLTFPFGYAQNEDNTQMLCTCDTICVYMEGIGVYSIAISSLI